MKQISLQDISKSFSARKVLQHTGLTLRAGECQLLIGANGAGKSTLLRICAGLEKPDSCRIDIGAGYLTWRQYRHVLLTHVVYLHQQPYMFDGSVIRNLAYALPRQLDKVERAERIDIALHWAGLEPIADNYAKTLSGGERQRVALARAWLRSPKVMLLDEPSNNLDEEAKQRTNALLLSLKAQGIALLVASHEANRFAAVADSTLELRDGKLVIKTPPVHPNNVIPLIKTQQA
jgi:tungstate transport system ATP-binding protein